MSAKGEQELDAVIVGAGFGGLYMLHRLRGLGLRARVFEAASGVGGTWFWNRYPGARCDIESLEYSYQFSEELQQEWEWSERYAAQPEILRYLNHIADRFELRPDIRFETRVERAEFDEGRARWRVETDRGDAVSARFCVMATGCLSARNLPDIPGLESFRGRWVHTGAWPEEGVELAGRRVGVIGTGSTAIQAIPLIAREAGHLHVFQRTPNYAIPARNAPLDRVEQARVKADYAGFRARNASQLFGFSSELPLNAALATELSAEEREREFEARWENGGLPFLGAFADLLLSAEANQSAGEFVRRKIREIVRDPEVAEKLCPDSVLGCKRLCIDSGYYETFNRPDVTLVDIRDTPIEAITREGLRIGGESYPLDVIVFATGFDAMTGSLLRIDIRGRSGQRLEAAWAEGPRTYLGLCVAGFPNFFTVTGPGSPSVLSNMVPSIEQHVNWIADCIAHLDREGVVTIEATPEAQDGWVAHVNEVADATLFKSCNSWYVGANIPGKPRVFTPYLGFPTYVDTCREVVAKGYEGFVLSPA